MSDLLFEEPAGAGSAAPDVLARKWRPRSFATVVGQDAVVRALQHALKTSRLHHAYLLTGSRGVGKTTLARIFAKALNCETGIASEPCGQCGSCLDIDRGRFVDYIEIDAASNRGVGEIQQLLEQARFAPTSGRFKVYVIDEVHMLSGHAFNAMLKTLEEPPADVKFVLATTDPQKIPVTVLSRCLQFNLKNLRHEAIVSHLSYVLTQEHVVAEPVALDALARAARGSARDALSLTDQAIAFGGGSVSGQAVAQMLGQVGREPLIRLMQALMESRAQDALAMGDELLESGASAEAVLDELARLCHEVIVARVLGSQASASQDEDVQALAKKLDAEQAQMAYQIVILGRRDLDLAPDESTGFQMTLMRLLAFAPEPLPPPAAALRAPRTRAAASIRATPISSPTVAAPRPQASSAAAPLAAPSPAILTAREWPSLVKTLPLSGLTRQFAQQSSFVRIDPAFENRIEITVPTQALNDDAARVRLEEALTNRLGRPIELRVSVGLGSGPTAAEQKAKRAAELQRMAEESIVKSPLVQAIIKEFDATIVPGSIRWIGPDPDELTDPPPEKEKGS